MYKIIGANQVEYGPVTAEQLRQWIAEGRVNAQTMAQAVGETTWKPISSFPEFAASFPGAAAPPPSGATGAPAAPATPPPLGATFAPDGRARALEAVNGPGIGLIVVGALGIALSLLGIMSKLGGMAMGPNQFQNFPLQGQNPELMRYFQMLNGTAGIFLNLFGLAFSIFVIFAGIKMRKLESLGLCIAGSIIAILPCFSPCCCVGIPIGVWALIVLSRADVKSFFT